MKTLKELLPVLAGVLTDFRVIATFIGFLVVLMITGFIVHYSKKPPKLKSEKKPAAEQKPAEAEGESQESEEGAAE